MKKMPKITKREYRINGKDVPFDICYSPAYDNHYFYIKLPPWMAGVLNQPVLQARTQFELEQLLRETVDEYGKRMQTEVKVIFYRFQWQIREEQFDGQNNSGSSQDMTMCSEGVAVDLWFEAGYIIKDPTENYRDICVDINHHERSNSWAYRKHMPYTQEREEFFRKFREWLITGITNMREFFKSDDLIEIMDNLIASNALPFKHTLPQLTDDSKIIDV
jgi:hypothetical protein